jgi:hypothetical protein
MHNNLKYEDCQCHACIVSNRFSFANVILPDMILIFTQYIYSTVNGIIMPITEIQLYYIWILSLGLLWERFARCIVIIVQNFWNISDHFLQYVEKWTDMLLSHIVQVTADFYTDLI